MGERWLNADSPLVDESWSRNHKQETFLQPLLWAPFKFRQTAHVSDAKWLSTRAKSSGVSQLSAAGGRADHIPVTLSLCKRWRECKRYLQINGTHHQLELKFIFVVGGWLTFRQTADISKKDNLHCNVNATPNCQNNKWLNTRLKRQ